MTSSTAALVDSPGGVDQIDGEDGMRRLALGPPACGVAASIRQFSADKGCTQLGAQGFDARRTS